MIPAPRSSLIRPAAKSSVRVNLPDGKSSAAIPAMKLEPGEPLAPEADPVEKPADPALVARWLQQAVLLGSLTASGVVFATGLYAGCTLLTSVFRASVAMTSVAGLGVVLAQVMMAQIAPLPEPGRNETRRAK